VSEVRKRTTNSQPCRCRGDAVILAPRRMPSYKIVVAYDGTDFVGWQRQATGTSIQGLLEDALRAFDDRAVTVTGAGRTDAGVHALGQVAAFTLQRPRSCDVIVRALNIRLPDAVRVVSASEVGDRFNPRYDAIAKTYRYRIWNGEVMPPFERRYAWHIVDRLDVAAMRRAAEWIEGEHDFAAFQSGGSDVRSTVRTVFACGLRIADCGLRNDCGVRNADGGSIADCGLRDAVDDPQSIDNPQSIRHPHSAIHNESAIRNSQSAILTVTIAANGFLRHMVRAIVGTLVAIGRGQQSADWMRSVLESHSRAAAGRTAPAHGLFLVDVTFPRALAGGSQDPVHSTFTAKDT
jgi:tRNA pseudouridine38-40 synthase